MRNFERSKSKNSVGFEYIVIDNSAKNNIRGYTTGHVHGGKTIAFDTSWLKMRPCQIFQPRRRHLLHTFGDRKLTNLDILRTLARTPPPHAIIAMMQRTATAITSG